MFRFGQDVTRFTKKNLPKNFAEQLLNLEMEVELNEIVQIEIFQDLISLYMVGVEYYESIKDRRYLYFQRKLNQLMVKPTFIQATTHKEDSEASEGQQKRNKFEEEQRRIELDLMYSQTESKEVLQLLAQVKGIVESHTDQVRQIESMIKKDIDSQSNQINQRLEKRRRSKLTHSHSQPQMVLEQMVKKEYKNEVDNQINQMKQAMKEEVIKEEPEEQQMQIRKQSLKDKKWEIIQNGNLEDNKKRTNSSIQNKHRHSVLLTTKQILRLTRKRSQSLPILMNQEDITIKQFLIDSERLNMIYNKKFKK